MKSIKKALLFTMLTAIVQVDQVYPDAKTQEQIRDLIKKHQSKKMVTHTTAELQKFLEALKKDFKEILKHAPNTPQYKDLKKAIDALNPKEMAKDLNHIKTILKNVDPDIRDTILSFIPLQYKLFFMF